MAMKARWLIVTKKYVTPDLSMSRDEVEAIVRTYAPEGYAALGP